MADRFVTVIGRIVPLGGQAIIVPVSDTRRSSARADQKLHRLLLAARAYRDRRSQSNLTDLIEAAKDID